jgi:hypothetical protein
MTCSWQSASSAESWVAAGLVMILMAWGGMDQRMPTQVPPRRLARYPIAAGALLLVVAAVGLIVPGG